jgi:7-carboxy-7-deazaguanine synthase
VRDPDQLSELPTLTPPDPLGLPLVVSETFRSVQGEGPALGRPASFLRLGGCNLTCTFCDAGYTWDAAHFDLRAELVRRTAGDVLAELTEPGTPPLVIVTGGEPLLQQRPGYGLGPLVGELVARGSAVHVETNGTIIPSPELAGLVGLFVVSPKLTHAGMPTARTIHPQVLTAYAALAEHGRACLKVVCRTPADVAAAAELADEHGWPRHTVWIMPEGTTVATLTARHRALIGPALAHGLNTSTRLHILAYGDTRGT